MLPLTLHVVVALAALGLAFVACRGRLAAALAFAALGLGGALGLEAWRPWARESAHWANPVHGAKLHLLGVAVVGLAALIKQRRDGGGWLLAPLLAGVVGLAAVSTSAPPPAVELPPGVVDSNGIVRQTTRMSCAPAAAATLLRQLGIDPDASEAELAQLCRTDPVKGTQDADYVRGVAQHVPAAKVRITRAAVDALRARKTPCVLFVGLDRARAGNAELYRVLRDECGWPEGEAHTVVYFGFDKGREGEDTRVALIGDPRSGFERWGITHFNALWDGRLLEITE